MHHVDGLPPPAHAEPSGGRLQEESLSIQLDCTATTEPRRIGGRNTPPNTNAHKEPLSKKGAKQYPTSAKRRRGQKEINTGSSYACGVATLRRGMERFRYRQWAGRPEIFHKYVGPGPKRFRAGKPILGPPSPHMCIYIYNMYIYINVCIYICMYDVMRCDVVSCDVM